MTARRIAIVSDSFPPNWGGGIASAHYQLFRVLRSNGFDVRAFTFFDGGPAAEGEADIVRRGPPRGVARLVRRLANLVFRLIDPGRAAYQVADIVVRAWGASRLNAALAHFAPQVLVCPDHGSPALFLKPISGCRRVLVAHHNPSRFLELPFIEPHSETDVRLAIAAEQRTLGRIDKVIAPSDYMKRVFERTYRFGGPVEVIPNLVDREFLDAVPTHDVRGLLGLAAQAPLIYVPGGGNKFKGAGLVPDLLRALAQNTDGPLGIFLSGAVPEETREILAGLPDGLCVHAPGSLDGPANLSRVKACSFGVYPTLAENYSMALLEAALCGVPMVTFDVGGNAEIIRNGTNGFLVPAQDVDALVAAAVRLLDPATVRRMAGATLIDAKTRLDSAAAAAAWVAGLTRFDAG